MRGSIIGAEETPVARGVLCRRTRLRARAGFMQAARSLRILQP